MILRELVEDQGFSEITTVHNGLDAISYLANETPGLIFLDIKMPGIDGWLLCEIISNVKRWKKVPIILQSGLLGRENIKKGLSLGAHSYI